MEELEEIVARMLENGDSREEIDKVIKEYNEGKLNGVVKMDATATPEPEQASEVMDLDLENTSLEQYEAMSPQQKKELFRSSREAQLDYLSKLDQKILEEKQVDLDIIDPMFNYFSPDGMYDKYKEDKGNYVDFINVENPLLQAAIDKVAIPVSQTLGMAGGIADMLESIPEAIALQGIDAYNFLADDENKISNQYKQELRKAIESYMPIDDIFNIASEEVYRFTTEREGDPSIYAAIESGDYLEALDRSLSGLAGAIPSIVAAYSGPIGLLAIGASSAGQHYEDLSEANQDEIGLKMLGASLVQGGIELASESVTRGLFGGVGKMLPGALGKQVASTLGGRIAAGAFFEGASEVASQEANNAIDEMWNINRFYDQEGNFDGKALMMRIFDTFLISSVVGGGIQGGLELTGAQKALEADRLMSPENRAQNAATAAYITDLEQQNRNLNNPQYTEDIIRLKANLRRSNKNNQILVENLNKNEKLEILDLLQKNEDLKAEQRNLNLNEKQKEINEKLFQKNKYRLNEISRNKLNELVEQKKAKTLEFAESAGVLGLESVELDPDAYNKKAKEIVTKKINSDSSMSAVEKSQAIDKIQNKNFSETSGGFVIDDGTMFFNVDKLKDLDQLNVGSHEVLHPIINEIIGNTKQQGKLVEDFKNSLTQEQKDFMEVEMKDRGYTDKSSYNREYLTVFSDSIQDNKISFKENFGTKIKDFLIKIIRAINPKYKNLSFKDGEQVFEFMKAYSKSAKAGKLSEEIIETVQRETKGKGLGKSDKSDFSKAQESKIQLKKAYEELQQIDETEANFTQQPEVREKQKNRKKELLKIVENENAYEELRLIDEFEADFKPTEASKARKQELLDKINKEEKEVIIQFSKNEKASDEVQRLFNEKPRDWENLVIEQMRPITAKLVERRKDVAGFDREELLRDFEVGERGVFDLIRSYDPSKNDSLAAYINTFLSFRAQESSKRILKPQFEKDVTEEVGIAAQEDDVSIEEAVDQSIKPTQEEKSKLRRQIRLPDEQVEKVRQAVRKTFGTKLPPPNSPKFKKALRKAFDTELFKELKTNVFKARDDYKFFMSQNWKALYDAIPQETLNQSFAPFREAVLDETGKQKREKTPEGERIFRKKNITKEEFLDYFFSPDLGVSTRGTRKDAIVRMAAQELGFDATMETIKEPRVAEKIEFANPEIKTPELSETIDRDQDLQFSLANNINKAFPGLDLTIDFNNKETLNKTKVFVSKLSEKIGIKNTIDFMLPMVSKGYNFVGNNKRMILFKGRRAFFEYMSKEFPQSDFVNKYKRNARSIEIEGEKVKLKNIFNQSPKGITSGKFQREYKQRVDSAMNQRKGLFNIVKELRSFINTDEKLAQNKNETAMYLATLISNTDALVRTAAVPKYAFLVEGLKDSDYVYEHSVTAYDIRDEISKLVFDKNIKDKDLQKKFDEIMENYVVSIIPKSYDKIINTYFKNRGPRIKSDDINKTGRSQVGSPLPPIEGVPSRYYLLNKEFEKAGLAPLKLQDLSKQTEKIPSIDFSNAEVLNSDMQKIIENKTSIAASTTINEAKARILGAEKKGFKFFIPPSADDLMGLLYYTLGKGKAGETAKKFYNQHIVSPFAKAVNGISRERVEVTRRYKALKKELKIIPKNLKKKVPGEPFTNEQAVRVYVWNKQGMKIPGLKNIEEAKLLKHINNNKDLKEFADRLAAVNRGFEYAKPGEAWVTGNITTDLLETLNTTKRAAYLEQWQRNVDIIFSKENLNKLEAAYGTSYRKALENVLQRMKTGRNRAFGPDTMTGRFTDWINGSVGAIMFFNTRSALLQMLSATNFINWSDNNIFAAAKAFSNQKQYWSDFSMLFNSDFLTERRDGLKMNVSEADLADVAKETGARGVINKLLKFGFTPTQLADSFAIATGGASFYRNRVKALIKEGLDKSAAEKIAFQDFRETAEESQQSSRPDKISQQQAGPLGRIILAFANTPSQYARIMKKAFLDLKNRRGSDKENIFKILYYGTLQNFIFNALQQALFAVSFGDEEEEKETRNKKYISIANGMADSVLRGLGFAGAAASVIKNAAVRLAKDETDEVVEELLKISPPVSSKFQKLNRATEVYKWDKDEIIEKGVSLENPALEIASKGITAVTNLPLDRLQRKVDNIAASTANDLDFYQRLALIGGWSKWDLGIKDKRKTKDKNQIKEIEIKEIELKEK